MDVASLLSNLPTTLSELVKCPPNIIRDQCNGISVIANLIPKLESSDLALALKILRNMYANAPNCGDLSIVINQLASSETNIVVIALQALVNVSAGNVGESRRLDVWKAVWPHKLDEVCINNVDNSVVEAMAALVHVITLRSHGLTDLLTPSPQSTRIMCYLFRTMNDWTRLLCEKIIESGRIIDLCWLLARNAEAMHDVSVFELNDLHESLFLIIETLDVPSESWSFMIDLFCRVVYLDDMRELAATLASIVARFSSITCAQLWYHDNLVKSVVYLLSQLPSGPSLKKDLVQIIANMSHGVRIVQDEVRVVGGIPAILSCTRVDEENPLIREWAVFAIRNLCENNEENQQMIKSFEERGKAQTEKDMADAMDSGDALSARVDEKGFLRVSRDLEM